MFQQLIFDKILTKHTNQAEALKAVSELLHLNKSNVYRRFSGDIALKPQEIELLSKEYNFSLDELVYNNSEYYTAEYLKNDNRNTIVGYLNSVIKLSDLALSLPDDYIFYLNTPDIIASHYRSFPELFYFKMVQWNRLLWTRDATFHYAPYQMSTFELELYETYCKKYAALNHIEILDEYSLNIVLEQMVYTYETGVMSQEDVALFIAKYYQFLEEFEEKVATGNLNLQQPNYAYTAYFSALPSISFLGVAISKKFSYIIGLYNSPDFIFSTDVKMIQQAKNYFDNRMARATLITESDELTRRRLFAHYKKQLRRIERALL